MTRIPRRNLWLSASLVLVIGIVSSCKRAPERAWVELTNAPIELSTTPSILAAKAPAPTDNDVVGVCIQGEPGYELRDDFKLGRIGGKGLTITAAALLVNGQAVPLTSPSSFGPAMLCLHPEARLGAALRAVRIESSAPIKVDKVTWISTAP
jgi:hypothetical protein